MATEKKVKESANVIMLSGDREYKVPVENRIVTVRAKFGKGQGKLRLTPAVSANSNQLLSGQPILTESDKLIVPKVVTAESYMDLEDGKKIILDHIYSTGIKDIDKKKIPNSINGCKSKYKLDYYLANSILMFEGIGLNPKVNIGVVVEIEMV
jgi:hypothetical protein